MMSALYAAVSGLQNYQTGMNVIGNNIANVNTVGFKQGTVDFQDILSQTLQGASSGQGNVGGTNPIQVGLGMGVAAVTTDFTAGSYTPTGVSTNLAIQNNGFFVVADGTGQQTFTRAGNFQFDNAGNFVDPGTGYKVMGWMANSSGEINTSNSITTIQIPVGTSMPAQVSSQITYGDNLNASDPIGTTAQTSINVFDSLGTSHQLAETFTKVGTNTWLACSSVPDANAGTLTNQLSQVTFTSSGNLSSIKLATAAAVPTAAVTLTSLGLNSTSGSVANSNFTIFDSNGQPQGVTMLLLIQPLIRGPTVSRTPITPAALWDPVLLLITAELIASRHHRSLMAAIQ